MPAKQSHTARKSVVVKTTKKPKRQGKRKAVSEKAPSRKNITLKALRAHEVNRVSRIMKLVPKFISFYRKLEPMQIAALKYYKGAGSFFQSKLLADYSNTKKDTGRELTFPFPKVIEKMFYRDILGQQKLNAIYEPELPAAANFEKYIEQSYGKRVQLLNHLDTVYDRHDCPKLTGDEYLFRGMHEATDAIKKLKPGDTYIFKNFISTTIDRKVAENYSFGDTIFVLTGLKDIPFVYMPGDKLIGDETYATFLTNTHLKWDLSELTLPRNLEFEITSVEKRNISTDWIMDKEPTNIGKLLKTLKARGLASEEEVIDEGLHPKGRFIFARLKSWLPREPLDFAKIKKDAKFVLNKGALATWRGKEMDDD